MISILPLLPISALAQARTGLPVPEEDVATAVFVGTAFGTPAKAITPSDAAVYLYRIENRWRDATNDAFLHTENAAISADVLYGPAPEYWWSSYWELIPFDELWDQYHPAERRYYIRNRWTGRYMEWGTPVWAARTYQDTFVFPSFQGFTLEPQVVAGVPCFRIRWGLEPQWYAQVHIENLTGYAQMSDAAPEDWWTPQRGQGGTIRPGRLLCRTHNGCVRERRATIDDERGGHPSA
jgi:hypothetical protein